MVPGAVVVVQVQGDDPIRQGRHLVHLVLADVGVAAVEAHAHVVRAVLLEEAGEGGEVVLHVLGGGRIAVVGAQAGEVLQGQAHAPLPGEGGQIVQAAADLLPEAGPGLRVLRLEDVHDDHVPAQAMGHVDAVLDQLHPGLALVLHRGSPGLLHPVGAVDVVDPQAELLEPGLDLGQLRLLVDEIRVPVVAPVEVGEPGLRDAAQVGLRVAVADHVVRGDGLLCDGEHGLLPFLSFSPVFPVRGMDGCGLSPGSGPRPPCWPVWPGPAPGAAGPARSPAPP